MEKRKWAALYMAGVLAVSMSACGNAQSEGSTDQSEVTESSADTSVSSAESGTDYAEGTSTAAETADSAAAAETGTSPEQIDMTKWEYNADDDVYYQVGISYCSDPADASYETLAVFVPGVYMTGTENGDGTYTCELNADGEVNGYTASTAPVVMPINTPG